MQIYPTQLIYLTFDYLQLRESFDSGADVILTEEVSVHDVATILKEFFRDLPEPLLPREVYHTLLAVQSMYWFAVYEIQVNQKNYIFKTLLVLVYFPIFQ